MAEKRLRCEIITPSKIIFNGDVNMVIAPSVDGELGILPLHTSLVAMLKIGELKLKIGDNYEYIASGKGYLEVREDKVTILIDNAEFASQIDVELAERVKKEIEEKLSILKKEKKPELFDEMQNALEMAATKLKVAKRVK
ncbi:MAG: ATP synthase F1 subunit epsilon [Actinobacteria bacterium]|nr:ATP synthase F1 subunit epsilon [Actinomycetota bacterium]